jgi:hypothetical protein
MASRLDEFRGTLTGVAIALAALASASCSDARPEKLIGPAAPAFDAGNANSAAHTAKGIIHGWFDGRTVDLRYTKLYFCAEPPTGAVDTGCEVGAPPTIAPRRGRIPKIYALAPVGFTPDPATVHCPGGIVCINHPPHLDLSRLGGPNNVFAPAHSHIIADRRSGWHETINVRVTSLAVWNDIATAKSLSRLRELQALGQVGPDIPTNVYFFFENEGPAAQP